MSGSRIAVLATLDTSFEEARFVAERIRDHGAEPVVLNLGTTDVDDPLLGVSEATLRALADPAIPRDGSKSSLLATAADGARAYLSHGLAAGEIDAAIAIGGGQGSWMASAALRDLPVGFPRLLVSTAGRDVGQYTRFSDLTSVFSVTDVAGLNPLLTRVLSTAAAGICGMAASTAWREPLPSNLTAMTVYGITTAGARIVAERLGERGIETVAFHSNGVGGPTMEQQIAAGTFRAVLDWSITEVADDVVGGVCAVGESRLTNAPRLGLSQVVVPGGVDVVNFGAPDTMPPDLRARPWHAHTPEATLLRTNAEENAAIARLVADRIRTTTAPIRVVVPLGGFSALSAEGGPLHDPAADLAFYDTIRDELRGVANIDVTAHPAAINTREFANHVADAFADLLGRTTQPTSVH